MINQPQYIELYRSGELDVRIRALYQLLQPCRLCPRGCNVNRLGGEVGTCNAGGELIVSSAFPHFGEEPPLVGFRGSGTIFLGHCNLRCLFCQNYDISHGGEGRAVAIEELAHIMIGLQKKGCHNINFVTPTHFTPQIVAALPLAIDLGLHLPIVYNCGGYERRQTLQLLEGVIDIYMPDAKFSDPSPAKRYCGAPDYFQVMKAALKEMHRQVGVLQTDPNGIATRGMLIRHLVMPNGIAGSRKIFQFISEELSSESYVNIMAQYRPCYLATKFSEIDRRPTQREYDESVAVAKDCGLQRGF